jgi:hypothetical protein
MFNKAPLKAAIGLTLGVSSLSLSLPSSNFASWVVGVSHFPCLKSQLAEKRVN